MPRAFLLRYKLEKRLLGGKTTFELNVAFDIDGGRSLDGLFLGLIDGLEPFFLLKSVFTYVLYQKTILLNLASMDDDIYMIGILIDLVTVAEDVRCLKVHSRVSLYSCSRDTIIIHFQPSLPTICE